MYKGKKRKRKKKKRKEKKKEKEKEKRKEKGKRKREKKKGKEKKRKEKKRKREREKEKRKIVDLLEDTRMTQKCQTQNEVMAYRKSVVLTGYHVAGKVRAPVIEERRKLFEETLRATAGSSPVVQTP